VEAPKVEEAKVEAKVEETAEVKAEAHAEAKPEDKEDAAPERVHGEDAQAPARDFSDVKEAVQDAGEKKE